MWHRNYYLCMKIVFKPLMDGVWILWMELSSGNARLKLRERKKKMLSYAWDLFASHYICNIYILLPFLEITASLSWVSDDHLLFDCWDKWSKWRHPCPSVPSTRQMFHVRQLPEEEVKKKMEEERRKEDDGDGAVKRKERKKYQGFSWGQKWQTSITFGSPRS